MIRLNRLTDYAVVVLARMARSDEDVQTAPHLARETGIPLPTVAKTLTMLARDGLVTSQRGVAGGYALSRPAEMITMADIIAALEGPIALTACVDGAKGNCEVESFCTMRGHWDQVNRAIRQALDGLSLADMARAPELPGLAPLAEHDEDARRPSHAAAR
jgi:FeS assembly SUF system regulator